MAVTEFLKAATFRKTRIPRQIASLQALTIKTIFVIFDFRPSIQSGIHNKDGRGFQISKTHPRSDEPNADVITYLQQKISYLEELV